MEEFEVEGISIEDIEKRIEELRNETDSAKKAQSEFIADELEKILEEAYEVGYISNEIIIDKIELLEYEAEKLKSEKNVTVEEYEEISYDTDEIDEIIEQYFHSESSEFTNSSFAQEMEMELKSIQEVRRKSRFSKSGQSKRYDNVSKEIDELEDFISEEEREEKETLEAEISTFQNELKRVVKEISSTTNEKIEDLKSSLSIEFENYRKSDKEIIELKNIVESLKSKKVLSEEDKKNTNFEEFKDSNKTPEDESKLKKAYEEYLKQKILELRLKKTDLHENYVSETIRLIRKVQEEEINKITQSKIIDESEKSKFEKYYIQIERKSSIANEIAKRKAGIKRINANGKREFINFKKEELIAKIKIRIEKEENVVVKKKLEELINQINSIKTVNKTETKTTKTRTVESENTEEINNIYEFINVLKAFSVQKFMSRNDTSSFDLGQTNYEIEIPDNPNAEFELDENKIADEYKRRKNDMYAKYYGDKEYLNEYEKRSKRYFSHITEIENENNSNLKYKTVDYYNEIHDDEKFLLLDKYRNCLENITRYENGDTTVYQGSPEEIAKQFEKDKAYVQTRNHTYNPNEYTQKDLKTLGKYGEKMPYIQKQKGILKNVGRGVLNVGILARNIVAPVYRGVGKFVAQPIHKLVKGNKDASPYKNNMYHRMLARREFFEEQAKEKDRIETLKLMQEAGENDEVKPVQHPIKNYVSSRFNAIFNPKKGNEAVLRAGLADIKKNIIEQEKSRVLRSKISSDIRSLNEQVEFLENEMKNHPNARNIEQVKNSLNEKKEKLVENQANLSIMGGFVETKQTDAISDKQHAKASKEVVTLGTTVIKGFATGLAVKYIGPRIEKWLAKRTQIPQEVETVTQIPETKQRVIPATYKTEKIPTYEYRPSTSTKIQDIMSKNAGEKITGYYSVYGGEKRPSIYTLTGKEKITGIFQAKGDKGTGLSDVVGLKAPELTDKTFNKALLDEAGFLKQDITLDEAMKALGTATNKETLSGLYVSVGDEYWVKASDLAKNILEKVKVGEEVKKVVDVPEHIEEFTEMVDKIVKTTQMVPNERVIKALQTLEGAGKLAMYGNGLEDIVENLRNTHSDVPENKDKPREYNYNDGQSILTSRKQYKKSRRDDMDDFER